MNFDLNDFLRLAGEVCDVENTSTLQMDRMIVAYRDGARTKDKLEAALARLPDRVTLYAHLNSDDVADVGRQLGLEGERLRKFISATDSPLKLNVSVEPTGQIILEEIEDIIGLDWGVAL